MSFVGQLFKYFAAKKIANDPEFIAQVKRLDAVTKESREILISKIRNGELKDTPELRKLLENFFPPPPPESNLSKKSIISAIIDAEDNLERIRKGMETKYDKKTIQKIVHPDVRKYLRLDTEDVSKSIQESKKQYKRTLFFALFCMHYFYLGNNKKGIIFLCSLGGLGIWYLYDLSLIILGRFRDKNNLLIKYPKGSRYTKVLLMCIFLGLYGFHRFYVNRNKSGLLMLLTFGGLTLWWIYDIISIISMKFKDKNGDIVSKYFIPEEPYNGLLKRKLNKELQKDKSLMRAIEDGDKLVADLKKEVRDMQKKGYPIPSNLKRYLNKKYDKKTIQKAVYSDARKYFIPEEPYYVLSKRKLTKELQKDKSLMKAIENGDKMVADLKKTVRDAHAKGYKIPSYAKRYLNTKYD